MTGKTEYPTERSGLGTSVKRVLAAMCQKGKISNKNGKGKKKHL
jgi:hypothetical protein